jgi:2-polyprenyl-6-methoxyphenol hydroxylase-like FAD-dependent oxidoreductase
MKDQFAVSRWQLRQALLHQAEPVLRVRLAFERYEPLPKGGARVYFTNGTTDECDLVVGADGWDSNVRKQLIPNAAIKDVGMAVIYFKIPLTEESMRLLGSPIRSMVNLPCFLLFTWA